MPVRGTNRRTFIAGLGGAAAWPVVARAQEKIWRVGYLHPGFLNSKADVVLFDAFRQQLSSLGYIEGKNLIIDARSAEGQNDRLRALANELVELHPNAIVAVTTPAVAAAQRSTSTIPIVFMGVTDPIGAGFVKSFAHPGGNITGLSTLFGDLTAKSIEVLHSIVPKAGKIAVLMSSNPAHVSLYEVARAAAQTIGLSTVPIIANTPTDLERAFGEIRKANCEAVLVLADAIRSSIVTLAASARIPSVYQFSEFAEAGGLVSYGPNVVSMWKRSAQYVEKIFKGDEPAEMPVEQPTKFDLVINLKTAKALGIEVPPTLLARADEVIE